MLVATDVAARGIHVDGIDIVVHYDPADDDKAYLHRSGRTARRRGERRRGDADAVEPGEHRPAVQRRLGLQVPIVEMFSNDPRLADLKAWDPAAESRRRDDHLSRAADSVHVVRANPRSNRSPVERGFARCEHGNHDPDLAKIAAIAESATLAVDAKAKALKAAGEQVIGFGAGEPDFPTPAPIVEAAVVACRRAREPPVLAGAGLPELREAIAVKTRRDSGFEATRGAGARHERRQAGGRPTPSRCCSTRATRCCSRRRTGRRTRRRSRSPTACPSCCPTTEETGFRVTVEQLDAAVTPRTKALLFVSPSNPTGAVYPPEEVEAIGRWALERGIWVVTDEIYEHLTYGDHRFTSMPVLVPELADTCVVLNGVAKTYAMTGWRVGWMIGPRDVIAAATNLQSHTTSNVANVSQRAALAAVSGDLSAVAMMRAAFDRRGRIMHELLSAIPGVACLEPQGAFYCFPSFKGVLGREIARPHARRRRSSCPSCCSTRRRSRSSPARPSARRATPGSSFALGDDDLVEGVERISKLLR